MIKYLIALQNKSNKFKHRFALVVSLVFTLFILSFWTVARLTTNNETVAKEQVESNVAKPLDALGKSFSAFFDSARGVFESKIIVE